MFCRQCLHLALLLEQSNLFQCFISVQSLKAEEQELSRQVVNKRC